MRLVEIDHAITVCESNLQAFNQFGTEIESYLTRYLLIFISARYEFKIKCIIIDSVSRNVIDSKLTSYLRASFDLIFRSIQVENIKKVLAYFGADCKDKFVQSITQNPDNARACTYYGNIVINRHATAHAQGSMMTFRELADAYRQSHVILDLVEQALL